MCRFVSYKGQAITMDKLVIEPSNSLIEQSKDAKKRKNPLNGDGFGLGWYPMHQDPEPAVFVSVEPAWSNQNLGQIASKIKTEHFFAHVRDASSGIPVSQANCHPFSFENYLFMHNGWLDEFALYHRDIINCLSNKAFQFIKGNTDSECAFALFLDTIDFASGLSANDLKTGIYSVINTIVNIRKSKGANTNAEMNFIVSNGESIVATRFASDKNSQPASLFYTQGDFTFNGNEDFSISHGGNGSAIVSSEPLTEQSKEWIKVDRNHMVSIDKNNRVVVEPIPIDYQS